MPSLQHRPQRVERVFLEIRVRQCSLEHSTRLSFQVILSTTIEPLAHHFQDDIQHNDHGHSTAFDQVGHNGHIDLLVCCPVLHRACRALVAFVVIAKPVE